MEWTTYAIVCPLVFLAGLVDAVGGGGGLISLPAYLLAGLPAHLAAGTNKFAMSLGTATATVGYARKGAIRWKPALVAAAFSFVGSALGTSLALRISDAALRLAIVCALPAVALFLALNKGYGKQLQERCWPWWQRALAAAGIGLVIGAYDGLIGPGTGTFLILCFTGLLGFDLVTSSGCAKVCNLASNVASMVLYLCNQKVWFAVALPAALCAMLGGWVGARIATKGGVKWVRACIYLVLAILFVKTLLELCTGTLW